MLQTRIKIVFLIGQLGLGGSERQLYLLLKHLDKDLFECHVIVFNPSPYVVLNETLERAGVKVWPVPLDCRGVWQRIHFLYYVFKRLIPDIVHSWSMHDNPYASVVGWMAGVPVRLGSMRDSPFSPSFKNMPATYRFLTLHSTSKIVVNAQAILHELMVKGYRPDRVVVIPNSVETESSKEFSTSTVSDLSPFSINNDNRIVGIVANLHSKKNHLMFVEVIARVLPNFPDVRGLIVGQPIHKEPDLADKISYRIKELNLDGKIIMGEFHSDIQALMYRLTIFCLTSTHEGMPNVLLEAMAAARPVVATKVGGVPELVKDGVTGFLVDSGDVDGFARAVKSLLADPALAEKMGLAGRERVEREFGCEKAAQRFTNFYLDALTQKGLGPG